MSATTYADLARLLSAGLDLCVRARKMDSIERTNALIEHGGVDLERFAPRHNAQHPESPVLTKSGTIALWALDQYERDLAAWEGVARAALLQLTEDAP